MGAWTVAIDVTKEGDGPAFLRIARAITDDIRRGRLKGGDALPGSRSLAASLGVHRNTVMAAYRELFAEGWIASERARGTFVAVQVPDVAPRKFSPKAEIVRAVSARAGFDLPEAPSLARPALPPGMISLGGGIPDVRLVPAHELARAMRRVLKRSARDALSYGPPEGPPALRRALAAMVTATRAVAAREENVLVTRGSQMGLDLVARTLVSPGDLVAVEALGYRPAWDALCAAGARLVPIPVDAQGLDVEALSRVAADEKLRGVYVTPHHQYPTTVTLAPARRLRLLELAREKRFFVIEDDYDHEFHYEGRPVLPLASADAHGVVLYLGTLSKVLAPGLRLGFVVAPLPVAARLAGTRHIVDRQGDSILELAIAELLEEGAIQRHIRRAKRIYEERRAVLAELLRSRLGSVLDFRLPNGGTAIWARVAPDVALDAWVTHARDKGLVLQAARYFAFDGKSRPHLRLGFAQHDAREVKDAVRRMEASLHLVSGSSRARSTGGSRAPRSSP